MVELSAGAWDLSDSADPGFGIGLLILRGFLMRRVEVAGRSGAELLGAGDVVRPWQHEDMTSTLLKTGRWRVLQPSRLAVLDSKCLQRLTAYPEVVAGLFTRAITRARHSALNIAIAQQPRVDVRLHMLFWDLADRWGTVHRDGVHLPLHLTHAMLGDLVAATRPTVTKAIGELTERGLLTWTGSHWLLQGTPPEELDLESPQVTAPAR